MSAIVLSPMLNPIMMEDDHIVFEEGDDMMLSADYQRALHDSMVVAGEDSSPKAIEEQDHNVALDNSSVPSLRDDDDDEIMHDATTTTTATTLVSSTMMDQRDDEKEQPEEEDQLHRASADEEESAMSNVLDNGMVVSSAYGGLSNLGNTCYFNSGLQLLAALDHFVQELERCEPPAPTRRNEDEKDDEAATDETTNTNNLREEFLSLMKRLRSGQRVEPSEFKRALDERSPLFLGYLQQDSHEFVTTLLDLLNDDYEVKQDEKTESKDEKDTIRESVSASDSNDSNEETEEQLKPEEESNNSSSPMPTIPSLSDLKVEDISTLLHGTNNGKESNYQTPKDDLPQESASEPVCKLVGGRVSTPTALLPYREGTPTSVSLQYGEEETSKPEVSHSTAVSPSPSMRDDHQPQRNSSPIDDYFTTEVRVCLKCNSCKYARSHKEKYLHLSLDVASDSTIEEGLRRFFAPEQREIKCEKCFNETATQIMEIVKLPKALLFHLKRFIVDISPDYTSITYRKDQSEVDYDDRLSLRAGEVMSEFLATDVSIPKRSTLPTMECPPKNRGHDDDESMSEVSSSGNEDDNETGVYRIRSIVNHIGSSASCGHYTADASRKYLDGGSTVRRWTRFNDSRVDANLTKDDAMGSKSTAYMIMYELE